ncbi:MAG: RNA methyltransferase [Alphaproteobacteria bacterium]
MVRPPVIILVAPQLGENIGAAARAMATCALDDLRLVTPRDGWPNPKAQAMGAGAAHILDRARLFDDLPAAIADCGRIYATTARPRGLIKPVMTPRQAASDLCRAPAEGPGPAILFGPERAGLDTEAVALADVVVEAPLNPAFRSLNLAQAVMIVAYEWYQAAAVPEPAAGQGDGPPSASRQEIQGLFDHLEGALDEAGYFRPPDRRPSMIRNLRAMLLRAGLASHEVNALRGVVRALSGRRQVRPATGGGSTETAGNLAKNGKEPV